MAEQDFAFGVRVHGLIAALSSGTPASLISLDRRTQELADYHGIPQLSLREAQEHAVLLASDFLERADYSDFNDRMPQNWDRYFAFLETNRLEHIHQPGRRDQAYLDHLRTYTPTPGARPVSPDDPAGLMSRLSWLRQGRQMDQLRSTGTYQPAFELWDKPHPSLNYRLRELEKAQQQHDLAERTLRQELAKATRQLHKLKATVRKLERHAQRTDARFSKLTRFIPWRTRTKGENNS